jgi:uncharacterized protein YbjT (DUF2867 family)
MKSQRILVYGATGAQGGPVARMLLEQHYRVRVLARDPQKAAPLARAGAEVVVADFDNLDSLVAANTDVDGVFLHLPISPAAPVYGANALAAAEQAHVPFMIFSTSGPAPEEPTSLPELEGKREMLRRVQAGAVPTVILKPTVFMENLTAPWSTPRILHEGVLAYPHLEELPVSWITHDDVAAAAVAALGRIDLAGRVFKLGGPEQLTGNALAEGFAAALDRPVQYVAVPPAAFADSLRPVLGDAAADGVAALYDWMTSVGRGNLVAEHIGDTAAELGYTPTPLAAWLRGVEWPAYEGAVG